MTGEEMESLLEEIGWKRIDLARRLKVSKNVPTNWVKLGPPVWVAEYLMLLVDLHRLHSRYLTPDKPGDVLPSGEGEEARQAKHEGPTRAARMAEQLGKGASGSESAAASLSSPPTLGDTLPGEDRTQK